MSIQTSADTAANQAAGFVPNRPGTRLAIAPAPSALNLELDAVDQQLQSIMADLQHLRQIITLAKSPTSTETRPDLPRSLRSFKLDEVADILGTGLSTVRRLIADGEIVRTNVGHSPRVMLSDLEAYLDNNRTSDRAEGDL